MPLLSLSLPLAWKSAKLEVLRVDRFAAVQDDPESKFKHEMYMATARLQVMVERELCLTPAIVHLLHPENTPRSQLETSDREPAAWASTRPSSSTSESRPTTTTRTKTTSERDEASTQRGSAERGSSPGQRVRL